MTAVQSVRRGMVHVGDRLLERVVPNRKAEAVCGAWVRCCAIRGARVEQGWERRDPEHGGSCTGCQTNGQVC
jgi:hypothetical protein